MENKVDPWQMQKNLMVISDQKVPASPEINKGALLYAALCAEEFSELLQGLGKALEASFSEADDVGIPAYLQQVRALADHNIEASLKLRAILGAVPNDFIVSSIPEAALVEMADGTTDLAVVNSGFALSLGIDGAACYQEVVGSNLSKANPDTGVIDKDAGGKWIKGRNYRKPDLVSVLMDANSGD